MFQSTHPHGVRPARTFLLSPPFCFNPRTHTGCDNKQSKLKRLIKSFNPRTHTGCDGFRRNGYNARRYVSIHAPTRGATVFASVVFHKTLFQSTHPHGVRLNEQAANKLSDVVSIHAPTRGATTFAGAVFSIWVVSIHAPTRGATTPTYKTQPLTSRFNPRTHTGCDKPVSRCASFTDKFQSTHPHGVRHRRVEIQTGIARFNPRTHTGCDLFLLPSSFIRRCFNPRTHTGCDGTDCTAGQFGYCFNPRTHTGCDVPAHTLTLPTRVSIHAPTRGATENGALISLCSLGFNPRTHTGCDIHDTGACRLFVVSIHAPTRGATQYRRHCPK